MASKQSQRNTRAGADAGWLSIFCLAWNTVVLGILVPRTDAPVWMKAVFVFGGVLLLGGAILAWRNRALGGGISLDLQHDPVPHGLPTMVHFRLYKPLVVQVWTLSVVLDSTNGPQSGFGRVWEGSFPTVVEPTQLAGAIAVKALKAEITLPAELPNTQDSAVRATLVLTGDDVSWRFALQTLAAVSSGD